MREADRQKIQVIDGAVQGLDMPIVEGPGNAKAVIWPGSGALHRSLHVVTLGKGSRTIALSHPSDSVYYVMGGAGTIVDMTSGHVSDLSEGSMVHIDAGDTYQFVAATSDMKILGGPCPADPRLYENLRKE